ncbi:MAG: 16S rRNA (cytosine(967)-C(5))-methyltransferase RsmB [Rhodospirillales bacterium]|nr:16S rRNA (cytosine(967)-C(5))-methyltransferase RsmB [Rhodospirillales bacterium]
MSKKRKPSARGIALDVLADVLHRKQSLDETFDRHPDLDALETRDRGFARNLVSVMVRRLGQIDDIISQCLDTPLQRRAMETKDILRLGIAQLLFLKTPAHAAVATSVDLAAERGQVPYKKLINAVLRRVGREGETMLAEQDEAWLNTPDWLWESWMETYGEDVGRAFVVAQMNEAPLDISVKGDPKEMAETLEATVLPTGSLRRESGGNITGLPGFDDGTWWVQDAGATLPAKLFGDVEGKEILDLCAAPGGKTAQLAVAGANVTAMDRSKPRLKRLQSNMSRLNLKVDVVTADGSKWETKKPFDGVLVDAPCSATGTLRRHPDVARLKGPEDLEKLIGLQGRILDNVAHMVKPGGTLVYCTCSLQQEECQDQVEIFLANNSDFSRVPVQASEIGEWAEVITPEGDIRSLPSHLEGQGGVDGFYVARLKRD